jgi:hypothetical protein
VAVEGTQRQWGGKPGGGRSPTMGPNFGSIHPAVSELWASTSVGWMGERIYFITGDEKLRRGEERRGEEHARAREFWQRARTRIFDKRFLLFVKGFLSIVLLF